MEMEWESEVQGPRLELLGAPPPPGPTPGGRGGVAREGPPLLDLSEDSSRDGFRGCLILLLLRLTETGSGSTPLDADSLFFGRHCVLFIRPIRYFQPLATESNPPPY